MLTTFVQAVVDMRALRVWMLMVPIVIVALVAAAWFGVRQSGRTPGEILDYLEWRLSDHPKLVVLSRPVFQVVRAGLGVQSASERAAQRFVVPLPPPRRSSADLPTAPPYPPAAHVWHVGPLGPLLRIADAAARAKDGDVVEIAAGDYHGDVALWQQKRLTIVGVGGAARLWADGQLAEGKAIWVLRNGEFDISNIDFIGARASDSNGAGIRFERGKLRLRNCLFWDNQMGLLTGGAPVAAESELTVENSEFAYSHVDGRWGHNLYVGSIARLKVSGSYSHHAGNGHLLKSRARHSDLFYNRLTDEAGGRASYEVEFPNGGDVQMVGNIIQQQSGTENGTMVSFGAEGYVHRDNQLRMSSNTLVNDHPHGGTFVRVAEGARSTVLLNNLLVGPGILQVSGAKVSTNNLRADWNDLSRAARQDYRLLIDRRSDFRWMHVADQPDLVPDAQYVHPLSVQALKALPTVVGALQDAGL